MQCSVEIKRISHVRHVTYCIWCLKSKRSFPEVLAFHAGKMCYIFVTCYWVFVDSLKSVADKSTLFYMNASTVKTLMYRN